MKISLTPIHFYFVTFLAGVGFVSALATGSTPFLALTFCLGLASFVLGKMQEQ